MRSGQQQVDLGLALKRALARGGGSRIGAGIASDRTQVCETTTGTDLPSTERPTVRSSVHSTGPLSIGGVGGGGTRVVAEIVERLGFFLGDNLNLAIDNLDYRGVVRFLPMVPGEQYPVQERGELDEFEKRMTEALAKKSRPRHGWGWKVPPTFLFLPAFAEDFSELRYIHVIRHGLDMALSKNTRQVRIRGHLFGIEYGGPSAERSALHYWIKANDYAIAQATGYFPVGSTS